MNNYIDEITGLEYKGELTTSISKAVKAKCLDCSGGMYIEVKECTCNTCPLWPFRFGKSPYNKRQMTEEQKVATKERMKKMWAARNKEI